MWAEILDKVLKGKGKKAGEVMDLVGGGGIQDLLSSQIAGANSRGPGAIIQGAGPIESSQMPMGGMVPMSPANGARTGYPGLPNNAMPQRSPSRVQYAGRFQQGGAFRVQGNPGEVDQTRVQLDASPGETVTVTPTRGVKLPEGAQFDRPELGWWDKLSSVLSGGPFKFGQYQDQMLDRKRLDIIRKEIIPQYRQRGQEKELTPADFLAMQMDISSLTGEGVNPNYAALGMNPKDPEASSRAAMDKHWKRLTSLSSRQDKRQFLAHMPVESLNEQFWTPEGQYRMLELMEPTEYEVDPRTGEKTEEWRKSVGPLRRKLLRFLQDQYEEVDGDPSPEAEEKTGFLDSVAGQWNKLFE